MPNPASAAKELHGSFVVIPARLGSTRLPRKPLLCETGKPLIQHTYESASRARRPRGLCVATDNDEIASVVRRFGGNVQMTSPDAPSGTDRVAEVAAQLDGVATIVNVQGDEPLVAGESIDLAIDLLRRHPDAVVSTLATPIRDRAQWLDPACVKVVCNAAGYALYFSRAPIPYVRDEEGDVAETSPHLALQHLGLYAYRREFLLDLSGMSPSPLERKERLEQLRVLEAGGHIIVGIVDEPAFGVDTPADYRRFVEHIRAA